MVGTKPTRIPARRQLLAHRCIPATDLTIRMTQACERTIELAISLWAGDQPQPSSCLW